jgi:hypothetical protein
MVPTASVRAHVPARLWAEGALALITGVMAIVTVFLRDWIEALTGYDPDHHSGSAEWLIIAGLALVCVLASLALRVEWRRAQTVRRPLATRTDG